MNYNWHDLFLYHYYDKETGPFKNLSDYMTLGQWDWLLEWYNDPKVLSRELYSIAPTLVSFTYGDLFPAMRYEDGKLYRKLFFIGNKISRYMF